ncbi:MAG: hypothetical protein ACI9D5_001625 [Candidatus Endobugula sp.]|jgi:hypothetical protein
MKKTLLALAIAGAAVSVHADTSVSGHVNYVIGDFEDFNANQDLTINDATTSQSRFRITSSKKVGEQTYGLKQEFGLNNGAVAIRVNELYLKGDFGKLTLGQGSKAGDGATESDFSGTYLLNGANYNTWGLTNSTATTAVDTANLVTGVVTSASTSVITHRFTQIDAGREERLRYDSPKLGGIATVSADVDTDDDINLAVSLGGSNWKAGLYNESKDANGADSTGGSVAFNFSGITAAYQVGKRDETATGANDDIDFSKIIIGYKSGAYSVSVDVGSTETDGGLVSDTETRGLSFVYRPAKGVELYAGTRVLEDKLTQIETDGYLVGGRVRF